MSIKNEIIVASILICLVTPLFGYGNDSSSREPLQPDDLLEDLHFLVKTLEEVHPDLHFHKSRDESLLELKKLEKSLTIPMSAIGFFKIVDPFVDGFGEGHTRIVTPDELKRANDSGNSNADYDWNFDTLDGGIGYLDFVNMVRLEDFKQFLSETFQTVKDNQLSGLIIDLRRNDGGNSFLGVELLNYITDKPYREISRKEWRFSRRYISKLPKAFKSYWTEEPRVEVAGFLSQEPPPMLIDFLSQNPPSELKSLLKDSAPEWMRTYLIKHAAHWLDLDYSPETERELLSLELGELRTPIKPFPLRFTGPTCILIGKATFSSAIILANAVEDFDLATLIGEETAPCNQFGESFGFNLPHSQLRVYVSTAQFVRANGDATNKHGVIPNIEVQQSTKDNEAGLDTVLEVAIDWVKNLDESHEASFNP